MVDENNSIFSIRKFNVLDTDAVVNIWKECGLVRGWNNTELDIQRKLSFQEELFFVGVLENQILADWIVEGNLPVRFQVQLHKYIWDEDRGR